MEHLYNFEPRSELDKPFIEDMPYEVLRQKKIEIYESLKTAADGHDFLQEDNDDLLSYLKGVRHAHWMRSAHVGLDWILNIIRLQLKHIKMVTHLL